MPFAVPVRVTGVNRAGAAFAGTAHTLDISRHGVRLSNAGFLDSTADVVTLQYMQRRGRFRVAWRGEANTPDHGQAGLVCLPNQPFLWGVDPGARPDDYQEPQTAAEAPVPAAAKTAEPRGATTTSPVAMAPSKGDKRTTPRFDCDRGVICWRAGQHVPIWGKLNDISAQGCFVETPLAFERDTLVSLVMQLYGVRVRAKGTVRSTGANGMGIHLREIRAQDIGKFMAVLNRLQDPAELQSYISVAGKEESALQRIKDWFQQHDTLSGSDFVRLLTPESE